MDLIPSGAQISKQKEAHLTFLLLLPTVEGRGEHGCLGASITADGNNESGGEGHRPPSSVPPALHLLPTALSQGVLSPLPRSLVVSA